MPIGELDVETVGAESRHIPERDGVSFGLERAENAVARTPGAATG